jgi:hypothetical protein
MEQLRAYDGDRAGGGGGGGNGHSLSLPLAQVEASLTAGAVAEPEQGVTGGRLAPTQPSAASAAAGAAAVLSRGATGVSTHLGIGRC